MSIPTVNLRDYVSGWISVVCDSSVEMELHKKFFRVLHDAISGFQFIPIVAVVSIGSKCIIIADETQLLSEVGISVKNKNVSCLSEIELDINELREIIKSFRFAIYADGVIFLPPKVARSVNINKEVINLSQSCNALEYVRGTCVNKSAFIFLEELDRGWVVNASHGISELGKIIHSPFFATVNTHETFLIRRSSLAVSVPHLFTALAGLAPAKIYHCVDNRLVCFSAPDTPSSVIHSPEKLNCVWRITASEISFLMGNSSRKRFDVCVGNNVFTNVNSGTVHSWSSVILIRDSVTRHCYTITLTDIGVLVNKVSLTPAYSSQYNRSLRNCAEALKMSPVAVSLQVE